MAFSLFKKKSEKKNDRYLSLRIREVVNVATDAVNVVFEKPEGFEYEPGQFITVIDEVDGKKIRRAYSLCTTPYEDKYPAVTVKRVLGGAMSNHINDRFKSGDQVQIMQPMGMFTTTYKEDNKRQAVFFGGGSGITPLMSILRTILIKEPQSKVSLVYGNRSEEYIIFKDLIKSLSLKYKDRFEIIHILEEDDTRYKGRPTQEMIVDICDEIETNSETEFYICGPDPMMDIVSKGLADIGTNKKNIMMESFEAGKTSPTDIIDVETTESEVMIKLEGEEYAITVKKGMNILEKALDNGLDMPYSCQSGMCTACRGKCLEGNVTIDEAEGLSQEELDEGYVLTCVSKPLSNKIVIEIG